MVKDLKYFLSTYFSLGSFKNIVVSLWGSHSLGYLSQVVSFAPLVRFTITVPSNHSRVPWFSLLLKNSPPFHFFGGFTSYRWSSQLFHPLGWLHWVSTTQGGLWMTSSSSLLIHKSLCLMKGPGLDVVQPISKSEAFHGLRCMLRAHTMGVESSCPNWSKKKYPRQNNSCLIRRIELHI